MILLKKFHKMRQREVCIMNFRLSDRVFSIKKHEFSYTCIFWYLSAIYVKMRILPCYVKIRTSAHKNNHEQKKNRKKTKMVFEIKR